MCNDRPKNNECINLANLLRQFQTFIITNLFIITFLVMIEWFSNRYHWNYLNMLHDIKNKEFDKQFKKMKMKTLNLRKFSTCENYCLTRWLLQ